MGRGEAWWSSEKGRKGYRRALSDTRSQPAKPHLRVQASFQDLGQLTTPALGQLVCVKEQSSLQIFVYIHLANKYRSEHRSQSISDSHTFVSQLQFNGCSPKLSKEVWS